MKKNRISIAIVVFLMTVIFSSANIAFAQTLKVVPGSSTMTILGTTNVHNFQSQVTQIYGELIISGKKVQSMKIEVPVKSIKSKEKLMDSKTYEAFNSEKNPTITFALTDATVQKATAQDIDVIITGNLTMAGFTKKVSFTTSGKVLKPGSFQFNGSLALKMTDFKMKPPTAMLGMMKVGDAVTLKFSVMLVGDPEINALLAQ